MEPLAFDCDSEVGQLCLRYGNQKLFQEDIKNFDDYADMYQPYGKYGLHGAKYTVGNFGFIEWENSGDVEHFLDSYYYYRTGDYFGEGEPMEVLTVNGKELKGKQLAENIKEIWENMILDCINRLKREKLGLDTTEDFIIFMCDHDISAEEFEVSIKKTVDKQLFKKLLADSNKI